MKTYPGCSYCVSASGALTTEVLPGGRLASKRLKSFTNHPMRSVLAVIRKLVFGISPQGTTFSKRSFHRGSPLLRRRLEDAGSGFVFGYHAALEESGDAALGARLDTVALDFRGFAFEGAAMGLALQDWLTPWNRKRLEVFLVGRGDAHAYMVHVGAGWLMARVPGRIEKFIARRDPLLRWLLVDGYGFHEGFFDWRSYFDGRLIPSRVCGYAKRVFHQGFGRSLWFTECGEVERICEVLNRFPATYRGDLWSGVGLASVYAGEVSESGLIVLREAAGLFLPEVAQGAAFAAKARKRAGNLTEYQDLACGILCGVNASTAAAITDEMVENLPYDSSVPAYEIWRNRIQRVFSSNIKVKG